MPRFKLVDGVSVQSTDAEETARDNEEADEEAKRQRQSDLETTSQRRRKRGLEAAKQGDGT